MTCNRALSLRFCWAFLLHYGIGPWVEAARSRMGIVLFLRSNVVLPCPRSYCCCAVFQPDLFSLQPVIFPSGRYLIPLILFPKREMQLSVSEIQV